MPPECLSHSSWKCSTSALSETMCALYTREKVTFFSLLAFTRFVPRISSIRNVENEENTLVHKISTVQLRMWMQRTNKPHEKFVQKMHGFRWKMFESFPFPCYLSKLCSTLLLSFSLSVCVPFARIHANITIKNMICTLEQKRGSSSSSIARIIRKFIMTS